MYWEGNFQKRNQDTGFVGITIANKVEILLELEVFDIHIPNQIEP